MDFSKLDSLKVKKISQQAKTRGAICKWRYIPYHLAAPEGHGCLQIWSTDVFKRHIKNRKGKMINVNLGVCWMRTIQLPNRSAYNNQNFKTKLITTQETPSFLNYSPPTQRLFHCTESLILRLSVITNPQGKTIEWMSIIKVFTWICRLQISNID